jgi:hypothetical protein
MMYYRRGRLSFYFGTGIFWLRLRDAAGHPGPLFLRVGRETK